MIESALQTKLLKHAWDYGHFSNPLYPDTHNVKKKDLKTLTIKDEVGRQATASVQCSDRNIETFCDLHHGRALSKNDDGRADGDPAQATFDLINLRRCKVPDFTRNTLNLLDTNRDKFGLLNAGSGGWANCDPKSSADHSKRVKLDERQASSTWKGYLNEVKRYAIAISADMGLDIRFLPFNTGEDWESSCIFKFISGGVIGFYFLPGSGCSRIRQGALDTSYNPDVIMAALLLIHEICGHGVGLQHTSGGIMNPSIRRVKISWRGDPSERAMRNKYGGVPLTPTDPPDPPTDPTKKVLHTFVSTEIGQKVELVTYISNGGFKL